MSRLLQRDFITTLGQWIANDCSALNDELKLREDNSDPIKIHLEPNCVSSPWPKFSKNTGREHATVPKIHDLGENILALPQLSLIYAFWDLPI